MKIKFANSIEHDLFIALKVHAAEQNIKMNELFEQILRDYFEKNYKNQEIEKKEVVRKV